MWWVESILEHKPSINNVNIYANKCIIMVGENIIIILVVICIQVPEQREERVDINDLGIFIQILIPHVYIIVGIKVI